MNGEFGSKGPEGAADWSADEKKTEVPEGEDTGKTMKFTARQEYDIAREAHLMQTAKKPEKRPFYIIGGPVSVENNGQLESDWKLVLVAKDDQEGPTKGQKVAYVANGDINKKVLLSDLDKWNARDKTDK